MAWMTTCEAGGLPARVVVAILAHAAMLLRQRRCESLILLTLQVAMLVEVELADGKIAAGLFAHRALSESVGYSIAAFARCP